MASCGTGDSFLLQWKNFSSAFLANMAEFVEAETYSDVTLLAADGGRAFNAHRIVLSAGSAFFRDALSAASSATMPSSLGPRHPVLFLKDVDSVDLEAVIQFLYLGQVHVEQEQLASFLKTAEALKIRGLTESGEATEEKAGRKRPPAEGTSGEPKRPRSSVTSPTSTVISGGSAILTPINTTKREEEPISDPSSHLEQSHLGAQGHVEDLGSDDLEQKYDPAESEGRANQSERESLRQGVVNGDISSVCFSFSSQRQRT